MKRNRIPLSLRRKVIEQAHGLCEYCLVHESDFYLTGEVDHIQAIKHGGTNALSNLAYCCIHCNRFKGTDEAVVVNGRAVRLFSPRNDHWGTHFELAGAVIRAKTEIGEVTVSVLKMNHPYRILERADFISKKSYPHPDSLHLLTS